MGATGAMDTGNLVDVVKALKAVNISLGHVSKSIQASARPSSPPWDGEG
jgi:hypothetical protein